MTKIIIREWTCKHCGDIKTSRSDEHHKMDVCKCGKSFVDLEEHYCRFSTSVNFLNKKVLNNK